MVGPPLGDDFNTGGELMNAPSRSDLPFRQAHTYAGHLFADEHLTGKPACRLAIKYVGEQFEFVFARRRNLPGPGEIHVTVTRQAGQPTATMADDSSDAIVHRTVHDRVTGGNLDRDFEAIGLYVGYFYQVTRSHSFSGQDKMPGFLRGIEAL